MLGAKWRQTLTLLFAPAFGLGMRHSSPRPAASRVDARFAFVFMNVLLTA